MERQNSAAVEQSDHLVVGVVRVRELPNVGDNNKAPINCKDHFV